MSFELNITVCLRIFQKKGRCHTYRTSHLKRGIPPEFKQCTTRSYIKEDLDQTCHPAGVPIGVKS